MLEEAGHLVAYYAVIPDDGEKISAARLVTNLENLDAIVVNGGTGISRRDTTIEVVKSLLDKELEGFGELFRMLSFQEIGAAAMMSRAIAGVRHGKFVSRGFPRLPRRVPARDGETADPPARAHHLSVEQVSQ